MPVTTSIHEFLRTAHVPYVLVPHPPAFTTQEEAAATHVPGRAWAKSVVCFVDEEPIEAVLPVPMMVNLERLLELAGGGRIRVAEEQELQRLFPECESGAIPPLGQLFGQPVFVDVALAAEPEIVFNAGTHAEAIAMRWAAFARSIRPIVGRFAERPVHGVGAFRLSYRE